MKVYKGYASHIDPETGYQIPEDLTYDLETEEGFLKYIEDVSELFKESWRLKSDFKNDVLYNVYVTIDKRKFNNKDKLKTKIIEFLLIYIDELESEIKMVFG